MTNATAKTTEKQKQKYFPDKKRETEKEKTKHKKVKQKGETTNSYKFLVVEENSVSSGNSF